MEMAVARMMGDGVLSDGLWIGYSLFDGDHEGASLVTVTAALGNVARYQGGCMRAVRDAFDVTQTGDDGRRASKPAGLSISSACAWWGSETETLPQLNADGER